MAALARRCSNSSGACVRRCRRATSRAKRRRSTRRSPRSRRHTGHRARLRPPLRRSRRRPRLQPESPTRRRRPRSARHLLLLHNSRRSCAPAPLRKRARRTNPDRQTRPFRQRLRSDHLRPPRGGARQPEVRRKRQPRLQAGQPWELRSPRLLRLGLSWLPRWAIRLPSDRGPTEPLHRSGRGAARTKVYREWRR
jgi:hypothetical protein